MSALLAPRWWQSGLLAAAWQAEELQEHRAGAVMPHRAGNCVWGLCMLRLLHFCPEVCVLMGFMVQKPLV